jgi:hypothetical protein
VVAKNKGGGEDDLSRACSALTVQEVWRRAGLPDPPREGNRLVRSPFREDKSASFSIFAQGRGWRDHASGERGGVWDFAARALGKSGKDLADWLIEAAGIVRSSAGMRPARVRAKPKDYPTPRAAALLVEQRAKALAPKVARRDLAPWPAMVSERWDAGHGSAADAAALAHERGWPGEWVAALVDLGLLAWPLLPWCDTRRGRADEAGPAFLVEAPGHDPRRLVLAPVGYHQRFEIRGERSWVYVPYLPAEERCRSEYQRAMRMWALEGGASEAGSALVPGLPFVLSGGADCVALVITEGQWDAVSFAGACGWLASESSWPLGWWVMGVRGAQGADTLLAWWSAWIGHHRPAVLVLADNDVASLGWDHDMRAGKVWPGAWEPGVTPSFATRLRAAGAREVVVRRVASSIGKDFNDYLRARRPTPEAMCHWLGSLGFDMSRVSA